MNNACDGESGQCRAEMILTAYGDFVLYDDAAEEIAALRARVATLEAECLAWRDSLRTGRLAWVEGASHSDLIVAVATAGPLGGAS